MLSYNLKIIYNYIHKKIFWKLYSIRIRSNAIIGKNFLSNYRGRVVLGNGSKKNDVIIKNNVMMHGVIRSESNGKVTIDEFTSIREGCKIHCLENIKIGKYVIMSQNIIISDNNNHPTSPYKRKEMIISGWSTSKWLWNHSESSPIIINDNVWICQNSVILKGVTIGENSIIAMNSVVTKDVPSNTIVAGNPATIVKKI